MASKSPGRRSKEFSLDIEASKINKLFNELASQIDAKHLIPMIKGEAAATLFAAAKHTRKASKAKIKANAGLQKYAHLKKGDVSPSFWAILQKRKAGIKEKFKRVGAAADGFLSIARQLNLKPLNDNQRRGIGVLLKKMPTVNGQPIHHRATGGRESSSKQGSFVIEVYYGDPIGRWTGARNALSKAIAGRSGFFKRNLKAQVFRDAKKIASKYPGVIVNPK